MLVLDVVDPVGTLRGVEPVDTRIARLCLLMFSASPATAALEICCVWWTTKEEALADRRPVHRPVRVGAHRFLGEHVEELLGGRRTGGAMPPKQSLHEHQIRNSAAIPPLGCLFLSLFLSHPLT